MKQEFSLQPYSACSICKNKLSDLCIPCQGDGQFAWFEPRRNIKFDDLPLFSSAEFNNGMPVKMRQIVVGVYMEVMVRTMKEIRG